MPKLSSSLSGSAASLPSPWSKPRGIRVLVRELPMISLNRSRARGLRLSPISTMAIDLARSRLLVVLVPSRSGSQLLTAVEGRPMAVKRSLSVVLPPKRLISRLVALLSLTRIISVAASKNGKRVPTGLLAIQPAPPPTTSLVRGRGSFQRNLPLSRSSRPASRIGVLIELAAGRGRSGCSWAKRPSSSTSRKALAVRPFWAAASSPQRLLTAASSVRASNCPGSRPLLSRAAPRSRLGALMAPWARWGASSLRLVPVTTPRPIPITTRRNTNRKGPPQRFLGLRG